MDHFFTLLVLGFAAYRATQLVVWDSICDPLRERIELWHATRHDSRIRTFVRDLIGCPYCTGWWLSMFTALSYATATDQWGHRPLWAIAVDAWAVAGIQALLNRWDDALPGHQPQGGGN